MTVQAIQKALRPWKKVSVKQVRVYIKDCGIQHMGVRQRPQIYPASSVDIILRHLGLNGCRKAA